MLTRARVSSTLVALCCCRCFRTPTSSTFRFLCLLLPLLREDKEEVNLHFSPHTCCCELFSGRDDGHRERRHEEERVFTRRARIEEFPQSGRGFSVRTSRFVASFVARSMDKLFRVTTGFALCGFVVMVWPRRNATRAQFQNIVAVVGDVRRRSGTKTPWVLDVAFAPRKREENHRVVLRRCGKMRVPCARTTTDIFFSYIDRTPQIRRHPVPSENERQR